MTRRKRRSHSGRPQPDSRADRPAMGTCKLCGEVRQTSRMGLCLPCNDRRTRPTAPAGAVPRADYGTGAARFAAQMLAEHERGDSYRIIGERYGVSAERVRQLLNERGRRHDQGRQEHA